VWGEPLAHAQLVPEQAQFLRHTVSSWCRVPLERGSRRRVGVPGRSSLTSWSI
jgi:hypothetical protein